jgi:hypothetical protein
MFGTKKSKRQETPGVIGSVVRQVQYEIHFQHTSYSVTQLHVLANTHTEQHQCGWAMSGMTGSVSVFQILKVKG